MSNAVMAWISRSRWRHSTKRMPVSSRNSRCMVRALSPAPRASAGRVRVSAGAGAQPFAPAPPRARRAASASAAPAAAPPPAGRGTRPPAARAPRTSSRSIPQLDDVQDQFAQQRRRPRSRCSRRAGRRRAPPAHRSCASPACRASRWHAPPPAAPTAPAPGGTSHSALPPAPASCRSRQRSAGPRDANAACRTWPSRIGQPDAAQGEIQVIPTELVAFCRLVICCYDMLY